MRLSAAGLGYRPRAHIYSAGPGRGIGRRMPARSSPKRGAHRTCIVAGWRGKNRMGVRRNLRNGQGHRRCPASLAEITWSQSRPASHIDCQAALQVWKGKVRCSIAPVKSPKQREERSVLRDRQNLSVAKRPTRGREREPECSNLTNERIRH